MTISVPRRRRPVEQATAAPGESRLTSKGPVAVCWMSFSHPRGIGLEPDVYGTVQEGSRLPASDPRVARYPFYFLPDGFTDADLARARLELETRAQARQQRHRDPKRLPRRYQVRCIEPIRDRSVSGRVVIIELGTILRSGDPWVRKYPDRFEPVDRPEAPVKESRERRAAKSHNVREQVVYTGFLPDPLRPGIER